MHVRLIFSFAFFCLPVDLTETRKTYRAVFSEPKVVMPATSPVKLTVPEGIVECEQSSEQLSVLRSSDGRPKKRTGDGIESMDIGQARKKKKNKN